MATHPPLPTCHPNRIQPDTCPSCKTYQDAWYAIIKDKGFNDIEAAKPAKHWPERPMKEWASDFYENNKEFVAIKPNKDLEPVASYQIEDAVTNQPPLQPIISNFPQPASSQEQDFLHAPEFNEVCESVCKHKNSCLTPTQVRDLYEQSLDGFTHREIAKTLNVSDATVNRVLKRLKEWQELL